MNKSSSSRTQDALKKIELALEQMLVGKTSEPIALQTEDPGVNRIIESVNMLSENFADMRSYAHSLAAGNLDIEMPGRRNYLSAPLKALHTQLSELMWTAEQLKKGHLVDRVEYMGELSVAINSLIEHASDHNQAAVLEDRGEEIANSLHQHQMLLALNHLPQIVLVVDDEQNILFSNEPAIQHFGKKKRIIASAEDARDRLHQVLIEQSSDENVFPAYHEVCDESKHIWYKVISEQIVFPQDTKVYLHCIENISEWKANQSQLIISATTDSLTGVYNRGLAITAMQNALAARGRITSCAAFIDIDDLKYINDNFGHNEGDYAIKTIAQMLSSSVRDSDIVSRFGGDEFIVVFNNCPIEVAESVIKRLSNKFKIINESNVKPYLLSFSYGIIQIDDKCSANVRDLIQLMDKKMYERKRSKKKMRQSQSRLA